MILINSNLQDEAYMGNSGNEGDSKHMATHKICVVE